MGASLTPFHLAVQDRSIEEARQFYGAVLGCSEGRSAPPADIVAFIIEAMRKGSLWIL
jgi:extradiol dioxygenase family protein